MLGGYVFAHLQVAHMLENDVRRTELLLSLEQNIAAVQVCTARQRAKLQSTNGCFTVVAARALLADKALILAEISNEGLIDHKSMRFLEDLIQQRRWSLAWFRVRPYVLRLLFSSDSFSRKALHTTIECITSDLYCVSDNSVIDSRAGSIDLPHSSAALNAPSTMVAARMAEVGEHDDTVEMHPMTMGSMVLSTRA